MDELLKYLQNQQKQLATQISEVDLCPEGLSPRQYRAAFIEARARRLA